jgi:1-acyl-sn-glycerol-3-phosphate acyltransferase
MFAGCRAQVTQRRDHDLMEMRQITSVGEPLALARTSSRAARVGAFTLETWSRLLLDGPNMGPDERARDLSWVAENMCALHGVRPSVSGTVPSEPSLLVANHVSYFDPLIIGSVVPCAAIAKREVASWPCIGEICKRLGVLYVERDCASSGAHILRQVVRRLESGVSVLVFPEGTTSCGAAVLPFKRGSFGAAALAGVPIVPVALHYASREAAWVGDATFLPHYLRAMAKPYTRVDVEFLPPLTLESDASALAELARRKITSALAHRSRSAAPRAQRTDDGWSAISA